jgi:osmoprotectant transport system ATP-binding protein
VFVGPSGCGKTTAMRLVNRMISLTSGDILLDETSVTTRSPIELRRQIGYVIQQVGLFPHQTVAQNVATVPRLLNWPRERTDERVRELLELIGLPDIGGRFPAALSGGQRQRVGVARALAGDPLLMLMDEPFGAIDPINRERLQNEFLRLQGQLRKTVVFVTHDIDEAIKMGDRIAVMQPGGRLAQYATPAELLAAPANEFVESFVGTDRALKRLALTRVRDCNLWPAPTVRSGDDGSAVAAATAASAVPFALLVDDGDRPLGWVDPARVPAGSKVSPDDARPSPALELDDVLRDALADLLAGDSRYGAVADADGRVTGVLSIEVIADYLAADERALRAQGAGTAS